MPRFHFLGDLCGASRVVEGLLRDDDNSREHYGDFVGADDDVLGRSFISLELET